MSDSYTFLSSASNISVIIDFLKDLLEDNYPKDKLRSILEEAIENENIELVKNLVKIDGVIDDNYDFTPLYEACCNENIEIVKILLDAGANINTERRSPLCEACRKENVEIVRLLLMNDDADPNIEEYCDYDSGMNPLHFALNSNNETIVEMLLIAGAKPYYRNVNPFSGKIKNLLTVYKKLEKQSLKNNYKQMLRNLE